MAVVACQLFRNGLQLAVCELSCIKLCLFAGKIFMLHLVAEDGQGFGLNFGVLVLQ